jgi:hypothetical protein
MPLRRAAGRHRNRRQTEKFHVPIETATESRADERHTTREPGRARAIKASRTENIIADDLTNRGQTDRSKINMSEEYEVKYWT